MFRTLTVLSLVALLAVSSVSAESIARNVDTSLDTSSGSSRGAASLPSVVVTVENASPSRGTFLTPIWIGIHDGTFDSYDGGQLASVPLGGNEIEALAEDGNNGPITATFDALTGGAPQVSGLPGPAGPLAPGDRAGVTFQVDPSIDRYFSYASMIIPSNDFFIANGNPLAHQLFDDAGNFVGTNFVVSGDETNDAGTELNDEVAGNVAFLNQGAPDTGVTTAEPVVTPAPGFAAPGDLAYPDGVLNYPVFGNGDFNDADDRLLSVTLRFVDLGGRVKFEADLSTGAEVQEDAVVSDATGNARLRSRNGERLEIQAFVRDLTGPLVAAHLHLGAEGVNGPVVADLGDGIRNNGIQISIDASDLTGPLGGESFVSLLNELAAGNIYLNLHTEAFPAGELRGQVGLVD